MSATRPLTTSLLHRVQEEASVVVQQGERLCPSVFQKPNGHGILEFVFGTLPAFMNGGMPAVGSFERMHQSIKMRNKVIRVERSALLLLLLLLLLLVWWCGVVLCVFN